MKGFKKILAAALAVAALSLSACGNGGGAQSAQPSSAPAAEAAGSQQDQSQEPAPANGGARKYYSLTAQGRQVLGELIGFWADYQSCVNGFIEAYRETEDLG